MVGRQELILLNQRRQALLIESELNRFALRVELEGLRASTARLDGVVAAARRIAPWLLPLAPLAGWYAAKTARRRVKPSSLISSLRWISPALALWRMLFGGRGKPPR